MAAQQQFELEAMTDMFNKMTEQCYRKCVAMYKEAELSVGEATCVDRCVHKYMTSHSKVQEILTKHAASVQQQQPGL
jgi:import inner membrane translocase subunit TIM10